MPARPVYLDHNATTPVDPDVLAEMLPFFDHHYGNASSGHGFGRDARAAVERARSRVAALLGASPLEIVFTSGGSEANNLALKGISFGRPPGRDHLITTEVEHPSVLNCVRFLERQGLRVTYLPVDGYGLVDPDLVRRSITPQTFLVSVMHANNEVGTILPIREIAAVAHQHGALLHSDATQTVGKVRVKVRELGADLLSLSGHKFYAPKGVGALYVRPGVKLEPLIHGSGHEQGRRAGTENVPGAVALGRAAELAAARYDADGQRCAQLRRRLHERLSEALDGLELNGHPDKRLPNTLNVSFPNTDAAELLAATPAVAASTASACRDRDRTGSYVLRAMGLAPERRRGAVRLSLGRHTTEEDIDRAAAALVAGVKAVRTAGGR